MKIKITETVLRDGQQSLMATRMPIEDFLPILETMDKAGYYSLEWESAWREELKGVCDHPDTLLDAYRRFMEQF